MPGSPTTPDREGARTIAPARLAFRLRNNVGIRENLSFAAQWLACTLPCRRFANPLTEACARLGADAGCYPFIVVDLHHLLLAGLPAHSESKFSLTHAIGRNLPQEAPQVRHLPRQSQRLPSASGTAAARAPLSRGSRACRPSS
jgi:hypothetical protein